MSHNLIEGIQLPDPSLAQRKVPWGTRFHFTGQIVLGDGPGRVVRTESHTEFTCCLCLASRPETAKIHEQVAFEWHDADGVVRTHYIDFLVEQTDGQRVAYTVRPEARVSERFLDEVRQVARQIRASGFANDLRLLTDKDFDQTERFNAKLLHSVRQPDPEADAAARKIVGDLRGIAPLARLADEIALEARGFRALVRLIRSGHLRLVNHERIRPAAQVFKGGLV
ncbi:hypothetical protein [Rhodovulum adriaticum]|uniref:TnsA endonuclease-like protein n=1 Tax=Rhodovulum adriaticum TaxID=35804 RepID=A0A4R2NLN0_RHOAD|nr:hypothetical protein [Rhodovulum adriaticum]MBK1636498.1 hypothetical protein [Rhodovulum adriaticum]TCP22195.1 hypothetical protein EV656_1073 [Rhodovulum adriaticum]